MPDINKAYSWAIQTCNAPNVGYSQTYRNQQTVGGITYYDCSSFINYAILAGGFSTPAYAPLNNAFTTYSMVAALGECGFKSVDPSGEYLPGDIGISSSHTEMCYTGGQGSGIFMGAHTDNAPLSEQVSISTYSTSFPTLMRYGDGGAAGYGFSIYVVSALCGNAWRESTINAGRSQVGGTAYGMFQWDGGRRTTLEAWLTDNGYGLDSSVGQLEYLIVENDWQGEFGGISSLDEFLHSTSTDIAMLTEAFCTCWERPGVPALEERIAVAEQCYEYILQHAQDSSITQWYVSADALPEEQWLNNAVMMYRYYSAGGGGGGMPGRKKRKHPIYMKIRYY